MSTRYKLRALVALLIVLAVTLVVIIPLAWFINTRNWGVLLILLAPFLIYALMRLARALERWVRGDSGGHF